eukprot:CAMPEP_0168547004 /NCGR_PEP_ID=MMETSP0413-20121227/3799_1 /TAXON_ID=136452 /ORGANISM="Filamoeba nolandi, Strain NC-AS-23-1" /LENGTH=1303 /DNA_ID=CAMNT_0008577217 /DNA_START=67 /DNA_END=3978 /DNA_ORIENTATION=+
MEGVQDKEANTNVQLIDDKDKTTNAAPDNVDNANNDQPTETEIETFPIYVRTCTDKKNLIQLQVSPMDNIQDIKQYLFESIETCFITNYQLYLGSEKLNEFAELHEIKSLQEKSTLEMREANYDEKSIRLHVRRIREILNSQDPTNMSSLFSVISQEDDVPKEAENQSAQSNNTEKGKNKDKKKQKEEASPSDANGNHATPATPAVEDFQEAAPSLTAFYPQPEKPTPIVQCLKSIVYSGFNPPPGYRRLNGDLLYLEVTTLENRTIHITGWTKGFYINATQGTNFNPNPNPSERAQSHNLIYLLNQVSPLFRKNFQQLLQWNFQRHTFELLPVPFTVHSWVGKKQKHVYDLNRAEDALISASDVDLRAPGQLRDWNEEYQSCKELPKETIQERIIRDRAIVKVNCDFVDAATKGAIAIINKTVPPINPMDPEKAHMYIYNNIFFSYATDGRDIYKDYGGDKAAYISINNDIKGIRSFNRVDVKGLYTLATAIVDYRGYRLCAQSIIPGILQREQTSTVVYGSIDNGKKISSDPQFHELLCQVGKQLHMKEHTVVSETDNQPVKLCAPVEAKGIIGTDGRKYILDLIRVTPRDTNYTGKENTLTILRPELIDMYCEFQLQQKKREKYEKLLQEKLEKEKQKQQEEKEKAQAQGQTTESQPAEAKPTQETATPAQQPSQTEAPQTEQPAETKPETEENKVEEPLMEEDTAADMEELLKYTFNPNSLCDFKIDAPKEEIEEDEKAVQALGSFLKEAVIPSMIEEWAYLVAIPVDGQTLTAVMHSRGINMRYLGYIATIADKISVIKEVVVREMITRAAKHILRNAIATTEDFHLSVVVAHLLNCLIGKVTEENLPEVAEPDDAEETKESPKDKKKKKKKTKTPDNMGPELTLTTEDLWAQITSEVKTRFQYDLPAHSTLQYLLSNAATLRSVCQKVGIQIDAADYDFSAATPFSPDNILNLTPVVKHPNPETADGKNLLEAGKAFLAQGRLDVAYELLTEALAIFHQVYGPMHRDTANCYGNLAMALFHAKDITQALDHQQKATIINERVLGLDHHDTAHSYGNLALFCHNMGKSKLALAYIRRALYLGRMICSPNHPDIATTFNNIAMMLQDLQKHKQAINYLLECTRCYENLLGLDNLQVAGLYHAIALAYSQIDQYKEALNYEKKNYNILHTKVGENDLRIIESNFCLKTFTAKAVQAQIETKKTQLNITSQLNAGRLQELKKEKGNIGKGPSMPSTTAPTGNIPMGARPLSEVMNFINEKGTTSRSFLQRNQAAAASPSSVFDRMFADENAKKKNKLKKKK